MPDQNSLPPVGLTQGDPAGIGPDIALSAWHRRTELSLPPFLYIGDHLVSLRGCRKTLIT